VPVEWVVAGMVAVIGALSGAVTLLWRIHLRDDGRRDALLEISTAGWREQTSANAGLAEALRKKPTSRRVEAPR
jgi:hypothetical protein